MTEQNYEYFDGVKAWIKGVELDEKARQQVKNVASMPFIHKHVAIMPDAHWGLGATVGSVIPTRGAIIPAAVGVDLGCGMVAARLKLRADQLPDNLHGVRTSIERRIPHGRTHNGGPMDHGSWGETKTEENMSAIDQPGLLKILDGDKSKLIHGKELKWAARHLGTLGTGNHFVEVCLDENDDVWIMLHSGSRGYGNALGREFISKAKKDMEKWFVSLPDGDLAYLPEGSEHFDAYIHAVHWAQDYAALNRKVMAFAAREAIEKELKFPVPWAAAPIISCHHNYVAKEHHFGSNVWVTRKGAIRAREGDMGIIPGSMGACSYIVKGKGNPDSFHSCSHGAGRVMSRTEAKKQVSLKEHKAALEGVECDNSDHTIDETPAAYKNLDSVMKAQEDLVSIVHTLRAVVCVKG